MPGRHCYPSLAELPKAPDVAVFCLGHERILDALTAAAERGMKAAVIYDGGFAERGEEGRRLQSRAESICREAGIALCGPNCMGILNPHHRSTTYLQELRDPAGLAGNVGIVSQSGGFCVSLLTDTQPLRLQPYRLLRQRGGADRGGFPRIPGRRPAHRASIGGFIEAVREPERFAAALDRAAALGKPVVVMKVGRHERTRRAITTHTGGDAGDPGRVSALLRAHRAIEVADLAELTEVLAACQSAQPSGRAADRRSITSSGGLAELILDIAAETGLELPPLSPALKADIEPQIGFVTGDGNPLDAWGNGTFVANLPHALQLLRRQPGTRCRRFCRDNFDDQPIRRAGNRPQLSRHVRPRGAPRARKPHYLLATGPGVMNRAHVGVLRARRIADRRRHPRGAGARSTRRWARQRSSEWREGAMADPVVLYEVDEKVSVITLNRPEKLNAISRGAAAAADSTPSPGPTPTPATSVVLLRAEGRSFCAGYDIRRKPEPGDGRLARATRSRRTSICAPQLEFEMTPWIMKKPVIASVQGHVHGRRLRAGHAVRPDDRRRQRHLRRAGSAVFERRPGDRDADDHRLQEGPRTALFRRHDRRRDGARSRHGQPGRAARRIARGEPALGEAAVADLAGSALRDQARDQPRRRRRRASAPRSMPGSTSSARSTRPRPNSARSFRDIVAAEGVPAAVRWRSAQFRE